MDNEADPILKELRQILNTRNIRTVFQPIISLKNGEILGCEALSRGPAGSPLEAPLNLFAAAEKHNLSFAVEKLCWEKTLANSKNLMHNHKLFINVNLDAIHDPDFNDDATQNMIDSIGINRKDIVIELTERASIQDFRGFRIALNRYREQGFDIAIDDTGAGYSGLQTIISLHYKYIKIDRSLIENIDKDPVKQALLDVFIKFAKKINASVVAEGVETMGELETLINLGIDYAQGFVIARPAEDYILNLPIASLIIQKNKRRKHRSIGPSIGQIAQRGITITPEITTSAAARIFESSDSVQSLIVLDGNKPVGLLVKERMYSRLATQYGYAVFMGRPVKVIMDDMPMIADFNDPVEYVSQRAMERSMSNLYNCIIVVKDGEYFGTVSIRNLLEKLSGLQIENAKNLNPLTEMPGNPVIERELVEKIAMERLFSVLYVDINNFKSYNDCYGYKKGDEVLLFTADLLKKVMDEWGASEDFIGHIGGDDFVIITSPEKDELLSKSIIKGFDAQMSRFYSEKDWENQFVIARDRQGNISQRPLMSISVAIISNEYRTIQNPLQVSELAAELKEFAKLQGGSIYVKDRRKK